MLSHAEKCAILKGVHQIRLYTNSRMLRNIDIYKSFGFIEIGQRSHPTRRRDILIDMAKVVTHE